MLEVISFHLALCSITTLAALYFGNLLVSEYKFYGLNRYNSTLGVVAGLHGILATSQAAAAMTTLVSAL